MVDLAVKSDAAWVCQSQGRHLADILHPVDIKDEGEEEPSQSEGDQTKRGDPVLLEQTEEGSPCVLTLRCSPDSPAAISRLLLISEARIMEVYRQTGEYCGTVQGVRHGGAQLDGGSRGPFYRKQLILEEPSSACEVKLLSLAGRSNILVCRVVVGLRPLPCCPVRGAGIDMQQVQSLVDEMGTSLSPGAQSLMDMVHIQQKNQTSTLDSFLPLLMGGGGSGVLSALARGGHIPPAGGHNPPQPAHPEPPQGLAGEAPPAQNGATSDGSTSPADVALCHVNTSNTCKEVSGGPASYAQLAEMMSHFLKGQSHGQALSPSTELLPMLQNICGQVTQLRLDDAAAAAEKEKTMRNGTWELDSAMERRLEEMEKRLKEHVDRRLDALEQKLEKALLSALPLVALNQGTMSNPSGGAAVVRPSDQSAQTSAMR
ncbi:ATPase PAAT [Aulostomus maculatus]